MTEVIVILAFVAWYVLSMIVSEKYGINSKLGTEWSFAISFILSPLIGFIATKAFSKE